MFREKKVLNILGPGNPGNECEHPTEKALVWPITWLCPPKSGHGSLPRVHRDREEHYSVGSD